MFSQQFSSPSTFFSHATFVSLNLIATTSLFPSTRAAISNVAIGSIDIIEKASYVLVGKVENIKSQWDEETRSIYTYVKCFGCSSNWFSNVKNGEEQTNTHSSFLALGGMSSNLFEPIKCYD
jgi:hypothetical protein